MNGMGNATVECMARIVDDRVALEWPAGRGNVVAHPEAVEGWAQSANDARDERDQARAEVERLRAVGLEQNAALVERISESIQRAEEIERLRALLREALNGYDTPPSEYGAGSTGWIDREVLGRIRAEVGTLSEINPDARGEDIARVRLAGGL